MQGHGSIDHSLTAGKFDKILLIQSFTFLRWTRLLYWSTFWSWSGRCSIFATSRVARATASDSASPTSMLTNLCKTKCFYKYHISQFKGAGIKLLVLLYGIHFNIYSCNAVCHAQSKSWLTRTFGYKKYFHEPHLVYSNHSCVQLHHIQALFLNFSYYLYWCYKSNTYIYENIILYTSTWQSLSSFRITHDIKAIAILNNEELAFLCCKISVINKHAYQ